MLLFSLLLFHIYAQNPLTDILDQQLPGYPDEATFNKYSGFIDLRNGEQQIHYIFMESLNNPETDPVVIYEGGGPGCSVHIQLLKEIGPYIYKKEDDTKMSYNEQTTHAFANVLYLDIPAGVGFSKLNVDYVYTDTNVGRDAYLAIRKWFEAYDFKQNEYFIGGESYGGMYVPYTAGALIEGEKTQAVKINLKGIMIGNAEISSDEDIFYRSNIVFMNNRNFYDPQTTKLLDQNCEINPNSPSCLRAINKAMQSNKEINPYNVYDYCWGDSTVTDEEEEESLCIDVGQMQNYFNNQNVRNVLKIDSQEPWIACNMDVFASFISDPAGSNSLIPFLFEQGVRILNYSGNQDDVCSLQYTFDALKTIPGLKETEKWKPFARQDNGQLAGWIIKYNYLTMYIIRGAGHMVPFDQRIVAEQMFKDFILQ